MSFYNLVLNNSLEGVQKLLDSGWDPNSFEERGVTALSLAAALGDIRMAELLISAGANINLARQDDLAYTPLICAARDGNGSNLEMVEFLIEKGADVEKGDSREGTPLLHACIAAYPDVLKLLIAKGAKVDCIDESGQTPLHYLCKFAGSWGGYVTTRIVAGVKEEIPNDRLSQHFEIMKILVENGADVNKLTHYGFAPLHLAAQSGLSLFISYLIEKGADVHLQNANFYVPLHAAADAGAYDAAKLLLKAGANASSADNYGFTPLIGSVLSGEIRLIHLLMDFGADRGAKVTAGYDIAQAGDTAADVAKKKNRDDMYELLTLTF